MFSAARGHFHRWRDWAYSPRGRRSARLAKLFLFEFVVVLLGVLAAQMVQEYAADARAREDARTALERAGREAASFRATAEYWLRAGPCLEQRMERIMLAAASGSNHSAQDVARPHLPFSSITPWSETTAVTVRRVHGDSRLANYVALRTAASRMADVSRDLAAEWAVLDLLDPRFGPVAREDRLNARLAAAEIKGRIAALQVTAGFAVSAAERLGVAPDPDRARFLTLPAGCAQVQQ